MKFLELLNDRPLLTDGGMGTMILSRGVGYDESYELLNITRPDLISDIHRGFVLAGADIIESNTFGANAVRQEQYGQAHRVREMNARGVEIARAAARPGMLIAGAVGPLGARLEPLGSLRISQAHAAFSEQIAALAEAGVDLVIFETFSDLAEIEQAIRAARDVCDKPIVAYMTFGRDNRTLLGNTPSESAVRLAALGADVIGANCSTGPQRMIEVIGEMAQQRLQPLLGAMPNAGYPEVRDDRLIYPATPRYFAESAHRFLEIGVRLVGGCCGTTAEHIRAMRDALNVKLQLPRVALRVARDGRESTRANAPQMPPTRLALSLAERKFVVTVEIEPPRSFDTAEIEDTAAMLKDAGATVLDIADAPLAKMRLNGMVLAHRVQERVGIETVLHFPVRGRNLLRVQSDMLGAHALNIRNLFVTMGDPTKVGDFPEANDHHDIVPTGLIQLMKEKFNSGQDYAGSSIGAACSFVVGCALNLTPPSDAAMEKEAALLKRKIDCGADFALTQPVFDVLRAQQFIDYYEQRYGSLGLPILAGILPLASVRHAEFFRNEVPGVVMSDEIVRRLSSVGNKTRTEGLRIAEEIVAGLRPRIAGVYIIPAFERFDVVERLIQAVL